MGITNPAEPHFRRGIWGWATSTWVKLVATAGGILKVHVAEQTGYLTVRQTVASYLVTSGYGWTGSAWRKNPLLWGYSGPWGQAINAAASGTGDAAATTTAVPAGEIYILQSVSLYHDGGGVKDVHLRANSAVGNTWLLYNSIARSGIADSWHGQLVLAEGATIIAEVLNPGDGKSIFATVWGYKMKVDE